MSGPRARKKKSPKLVKSRCFNISNDVGRVKGLGVSF
jgi:hypothetical protein